MPTSTDILDGLRNHLVGAGIGRASYAGPAGLPLIILDPRKGVPAPRELEGAPPTETLVISLLPGGDIAPDVGDGYMLRTTVDIRYRGRQSDEIAAVDNEITGELYLPGGHARQAWDMGGVFVLETRGWAGLSRLDGTPDAFDYVTKVYVEALR